MTDRREGGGPQGPTAALSDWADLTRRGARVFAAMARSAAEGVAIATTPKEEHWRDGHASLHRYRSAVPTTTGPLLILHGLFGRQTITDLEPDRSLVRRLLAAGADVWVLDWGSPGRADRWLDFTDYAAHWLGDALDRIARATGRPRTALLGICQGGVFSLCHAALWPERVAGLALAVTPVDFHADTALPREAQGLLNLWVRGLDEAVIDGFLDEHGLLPGALSGLMFQNLTPMRGLSRYGPELLDRAEDPGALDTFLRMEAWLADRPDHPAAAARQWLIDLYGRNDLVAGRFEVAERAVRLRDIACPILNIVALADHIVPPVCASALQGLTASPDYRLLEVPTGHIGVFVSARARDMVAPAISDWLGGLDHG